MELTEEQVKYARTFLECNLRKRYGWRITEEDLQDLISYALRKLVLKWRYYDETKGTWKTFLVCICKSSLVDCAKYYWRNHQRIAFEPLEDNHNGIMDAREDGDVDKFINDNFEGLEREVAMLKWNGHKKDEICRKLKISKQQYVAILAGIHDKLQERIKLK